MVTALSHLAAKMLTRFIFKFRKDASPQRGHSPLQASPTDNSTSLPFGVLSFFYLSTAKQTSCGKRLINTLNQEQSTCNSNK